MWPDSSFAVPVPSFVSPVPVPGVDPLTGDCAVIRINKAWIPYVKGSLMQLWLQSTWQGTPEQVTEAQNQAIALVNAINDLEPGGCGQPDFIPPIQESEYQMSICEQLRFQDGKLQGLCCGEWVDIDGQTSVGLPPTPDQPGSGSTVPAPGGGTAEYCGVIRNDVWLLPVPVNSGDTLLFTDLSGAWKDSADLLVWECPNGWNYALGTCFERGAGGGSDPMPTKPHMAIIGSINGTFYDVLQIDSNGNPTTWTVPGGITNGQLLLQANIDDISRVQGEVGFCTIMTNNQLGAWTSTFDFTLNDFISLMTSPNFSWVPGSGLNGINAGPTNLSAVSFQFIANPVDVTQMIATYDCAGFAGGSAVVAFYDNSGFYGTHGTPTVGTGELLQNFGSATLNQPGFQLDSGSDPGPVNVSKLVISGRGARPSGWPTS